MEEIKIYYAKLHKTACEKVEVLTKCKKQVAYGQKIDYSKDTKTIKLQFENKWRIHGIFKNNC